MPEWTGTLAKMIASGVASGVTVGVLTYFEGRKDEAKAVAPVIRELKEDVKAGNDLLRYFDIGIVEQTKGK